MNAATSSLHPSLRFVFLQILVIVGGLLVLGACMKLWGYPHNPDLRWNPLAIFVRHHGAWLLLLPLASYLGCLYAEHKWPASFTSDETSALALCLFLALFLFFASVVAVSQRHPLIVRATPPPAKIAKRFQPAEQ